MPKFRFTPVLRLRPRIPPKSSLFFIIIAAFAFISWGATEGASASGPLFVSPEGNDANDCQTFIMACRTIGAAVAKASADDTIIIASGIYTESVTLSKNVTMIGFGSDATIISGAGISQALQIPAGIASDVYDLAVVRSQGGILNQGVLTLTNSLVANSTGGGSGIYNQGVLMVNTSVISGNPGYAGGGIINTGVLTLNQSTVRGNQAFLGGGIQNYHGTATIIDSTIISNSVHEAGAGINNDGGVLIVNNSLIANNLACNTSCPFFAVRPSTAKAPANGYDSIGGGIASDGVLTITNSTISGNSVMFGDSGGVFSFGSANISNTTISGNTAIYGAGIHNASFMTLTNVTLSGNSVDDIRNDGSLWMHNTIVDNGGCAGNAVVSRGHNLSTDNSCALTATGDLTNTNPLLGPLQNNGGPTPTHALLAGSPAINHGDNAGCPATDQRGIVRPQAGICDIGAFEYVFPYSMYLPFVRR